MKIDRRRFLQGLGLGAIGLIVPVPVVWSGGGDPGDPAGDIVRGFQCRIFDIAGEVARIPVSYINGEDPGRVVVGWNQLIFKWDVGDIKRDHVIFPPGQITIDRIEILGDTIERTTQDDGRFPRVNKGDRLAVQSWVEVKGDKS